MNEKKTIRMFYPYISSKVMSGLEEIIRGRWVGQGAKVAELEEKIKELCDAPYAVAVNNVSAAIRLALGLIGVGPGDQVITTPQTCTATNHPILEQFAEPVFADIQYLTGNIDPGDIEKRITERTKAIICLHWGGYPSDLNEIQTIASKYNIPVIEDAQDALGASCRGKKIGSISDFTCFSFGAVQQITTGEGGMLCVKDEEYYQAGLRRRWYGIDRIKRTPNNLGYYDFDITETGYGYHLTNIAAEIGLCNLEDLPSIAQKRDKIAQRYRNGLEGVDGVTLFKMAGDYVHANQLFTMHVRDRDKFCQMMKSKGIETSIVHERNDAYSVFGSPRKDLPELDKFTETNISIPMNNSISDDDAEYLIESIKQGW